jgi:two-component system sensor histidine kinase KdpD
MPSDPQPGKRGRLRVYLGYAAGVGKTYQMLEEGQSLRRQGADVVLGYLEPHGRVDTIAKAEDLEVIPRRKLEYRGSAFEEMDTDAILRRKPAICLADELPHTNVPGSGREKRWEDVIALLDAGIEVFTTMNIQHLESLNDQVFQITGVRVRETAPDWVIREAGEVVMVDLTPRALLNRLQRGVIYRADKVQRAMDHFFKESTLVALRELALRETAHEVNLRYVDMTGRLPGALAPDLSSPGVQRGEDRILVWVTGEDSSAALIRRARRVADYLQAGCFAVCLEGKPDLGGKAGPRREALEKMLNFARNLHIETRILEGPDTAAAFVEFARLHKITHIFVARPRYTGARWFLGRHLIHRIVDLSKDMEVTIVAERRNLG